MYFRAYPLFRRSKLSSTSLPKSVYIRCSFSVQFLGFLYHRAHLDVLGAFRFWHSAAPFHWFSVVPGRPPGLDCFVSAAARCFFFVAFPPPHAPAWGGGSGQHAFGARCVAPPPFCELTRTIGATRLRARSVAPPPFCELSRMTRATRLRARSVASPPFCELLRTIFHFGRFAGCPGSSGQPFTWHVD